MAGFALSTEEQAQADFHPLPFDAPAARIFGGVAFIAASSGS